MYQPVLVSRASAPLVTAHIRFRLKLVVESFAGVEHVQPFVDKLLKYLHLKELPEERLHAQWARKDERVRVKGYLLTGPEL